MAVHGLLLNSKHLDIQSLDGGALAIWICCKLLRIFSLLCIFQVATANTHTHGQGQRYMHFNAPGRKLHSEPVQVLL